MASVILPPPDIRTIVEKLAAYVVKNGAGFEDKILEKERHNPRFSFLYPNDPYHPYYQKRLHEYRQAGPGITALFLAVNFLDAVDEMLARSKEMEPTRFERQAPVAMKPVEKKIPKEPSSLDFLLDIPPISALDYDVLKLTAKYVARNGRQFLLNLSQREMRNPQFDFLRPNHSLHSIFLRLVEQYSRVLMPSRSLLEKLELYETEKHQVLGLILQRVEYTRYIRAQQLKEDEIAERERLAFAAIDWHDFVIAETIDFGPSDRNMVLPKPLEYAAITNMSMVQRKELWNGNTLAGLVTATPELQEEAMDVEETVVPIMPAESVAPAVQAAVEPSVPSAKRFAGAGNIRIREDYIPKAQAAAASTTEAVEICPICSQPVPKSQIAEHMRIEGLDPKWKEQRDRHIAKHRETNYVVSGAEVSQNLQAMTKVRKELSGMQENDASRLVSDANKAAASQTVIWDGRSEVGSIDRATKEAMQKAKAAEDSQASERTRSRKK